MKKGNDRDKDRKRVLAAIQAEQKVADAEKALDLACAGSRKAYQRMVGRLRLKGLQELNAIFEDLKDSHEGSTAFEIIWHAVKDHIEDYTSGRMKKAA